MFFEEEARGACNMDNEDHTLPRATVNKMIREFLPEDFRLASDTSDLLMECCTEFIQLVASEANEHCIKDSKKVISPEHVMSALESLQFVEYMEKVTDTFKEHKQSMKEGPSGRIKGKKSQLAGMTREEQLALQQKLFGEAKSRCFKPEENSPSNVA